MVVIAYTGAFPGPDTPGWEGTNGRAILQFHFDYMSTCATGAAKLFPKGSEIRQNLDRCTWQYHIAGWVESRMAGQNRPGYHWFAAQGTNGNDDPPFRPQDGEAWPMPYIWRVFPMTGNSPPETMTHWCYLSLACLLNFLRLEGRADDLETAIGWVLDCCYSTTIPDAITFLWNEANAQQRPGGDQGYALDSAYPLVGELERVLRLGGAVASVPLSWSGSASQNVDEGGTLTLSLVLAEALAELVVVEVQIGAGTATYGTHYTTVPSGATGTITVTIPAGQTSADIVVTTFATDKDRAFSLTIVEPLDERLDLSGYGTKVVRINDTAPPNTVHWDVASDSMQELTTKSLGVSLDQAETAMVTLTIVPSGTASYGTDYTTNPPLSSGRILLPIPAGQTAGALEVVAGDVASDKSAVFSITGVS